MRPGFCNVAPVPRIGTPCKAQAPALTHLKFLRPMLARSGLQDPLVGQAGCLGSLSPFESSEKNGEEGSHWLGGVAPHWRRFGGGNEHPVIVVNSIPMRSSWKKRQIPLHCL